MFETNNISNLRAAKIKGIWRTKKDYQLINETKRRTDKPLKQKIRANHR
jgi:hypothetical protein